MGWHHTPFPLERRLVIDSTRLGSRSPRMLGLIEADVTEARARLRAWQERTGEKLSFTAWLLYCLGRAVGRHPEVHAFRDLRGRLVWPDDVDVAVSIEIEREGRSFPLSHLMRATQRRSVRELHEEIRSVQAAPSHRVSRRMARGVRALLWIPGPLRRLLMRLLLRSPGFRERVTGTVGLSSVGMFARIAGWAVSPASIFSLFVLAGGLEKAARLVDGKLEPRERLRISLSFDHDLVDGAPATRFTGELVELLESAGGLEEIG